MTQQRQRVSGPQKTQDALTAETIGAVQRFYDAFNRHDLDALVAAITDNCVFESPYPLPDGTRYEGQDAVRAYYKEVIRARLNAVLGTEEMFAAGDRCVARWVFRWTDEGGKPQHYRGVDVFRVGDGKVAEKLSYHKRNRSN